MRRALLIGLVSTWTWTACGAPAAQQAPVAPDSEAAASDPAAFAAVAGFFMKKRAIVAACLSNAITNREVPEQISGRVHLALRVLPSGQPENIRITESTLKAKTVEDCVVQTVGRWTLPAPAHALDFVYVYELRNQ